MDRTPAPPRGVSLSQILSDASLPSGDITVSSCCADSRACRPGDLFVALPGSAADGHNHVNQAVERGATAILAGRPLGECPVPVCYVDDVARAFGEVCHALAGNPARRLKTIGITGTNGKTTTSYLIGSVLSAAGQKTGVLGTLGYFDGQEWADAGWTTPPANVMAQWMARMVANGCTHAVMEVSSHALAQQRLAGVDLDVACLTNVRRDHLDYHGTWGAYRDTKARLFDRLAPEGFAVVNVDDPAAESLLARVDGPVLSVGINAPAEVTAVPVEQFASEQTFLLSAGEETIAVRTPLIGAHNITNCLMAAAVGLVYSIDLPTIVAGLEAIPRVPGRLERIECGQPFSVFVDYAHTPDALSASLTTLRAVTRGRLICVFGAGGDRDKSKRGPMGRAVEEVADVAVVTSDNPRGERPAAIIEQIVAGCAEPSAVRTIVDRHEAIVWALEQAQPGDCVLLAGKGHETYQMIGDRRFHFDDREVARNWLYEMAPALGRAA
ncbi:MAG TPA: UDP-N-acetylmuramoyl-L-alanyl-D-glutamate--2,6-diaminopimelate ligase [Pirellulales bacterium]|nr:UDP-N-acetylmuramoyl-L-alanyl-D-glutamate--2,6-diaminopimelate ligase [Pirellulales bacterium]